MSPGRTRVGVFTAATLVAGLVGCGGAASGASGASGGLLAVLADDLSDGPDSDDGLGLHPGESMTFEVSLGGMVGGEAAFAVGEPGTVDGRDAIMVRSSIASVGALRLLKVIDDELTTTIDVETGLPMVSTADVVFGAKRYHHDARYDRGKVELEWHKGDGNLRYTSYDFEGAVAHDAHTAMAALRTWHGQPGETRRMYLVGGKRIWQTDVTWAGVETIGTTMGNQSAVRLDGVAIRVTKKLLPEVGKEGRTFSVWLTDDGDRAPVRTVAHTELGDVLIELTGYQRP